MSVVMKALNTISTMENEPTLENGGSADELAKAAADIVRCHEVTNQKLIDFYTKMVDELKPKKEVVETERDKFLTWVKECAANVEPDAEAPDYARLWKEIKS